jgi:hypothetical protein
VRHDVVNDSVIEFDFPPAGVPVSPKLTLASRPAIYYKLLFVSELSLGIESLMGLEINARKDELRQDFIPCVEIFQAIGFPETWTR